MVQSLRVSHLAGRSWFSSVALIALAAGIIVMPPQERSWAQNMPPQPAAIGAPAANVTENATPVVPGSPVDPSAGLPGVPAAAAAPTAGVQSSSGTYEQMDPAAFKDLEVAMSSMAVLRKNITPPEDVGTLVFTLWQHALLQDAKKMFRTRRPTESEIAAAADGSAAEVKPRGIREIGLNGILYKGKDNWVVWLNGKRLAPDAIPKEVIDIKVHSTYIDLKWFDAYTNLIYPIRIRPHQRFNLDTRIFLPGITADAAAEMQAASTTSLQ